MICKCGAEIEKGVFEALKGCPYCKVCKETDIHIWSDKSPCCVGLPAHCIICYKDQSGLTVKLMKEILNDND